jgi:hypothetical protein
MHINARPHTILKYLVLYVIFRLFDFYIVLFFFGCYPCCECSQLVLSEYDTQTSGQYLSGNTVVLLL